MLPISSIKINTDLSILGIYVYDSIDKSHPIVPDDASHSFFSDVQAQLKGKNIPYVIPNKKEIMQSDSNLWIDIVHAVEAAKALQFDEHIIKQVQYAVDSILKEREQKAYMKRRQLNKKDFGSYEIMVDASLSDRLPASNCNTR